MAICNLLAIWYIYPRFGLLCQEKSGNPGPGQQEYRKNGKQENIVGLFLWRPIIPIMFYSFIDD
jgi:hypothetical protein